MYVWLRRAREVSERGGKINIRKRLLIGSVQNAKTLFREQIALKLKGEIKTAAHSLRNHLNEHKNGKAGERERKNTRSRFRFDNGQALKE